MNRVKKSPSIPRVADRPFYTNKKSMVEESWWNGRTLIPSFSRVPADDWRGREPKRRYRVPVGKGECAGGCDME